MPCDASHCEPTRREREAQRVCRLLVYVSGELRLAHSPKWDWIRGGARAPYGCPLHRLDEATAMLCDICRTMSEEEQTRIIYDGRNKMARELADWYDEHLEADRQKQATRRIRPNSVRRLVSEKIPIGRYPGEWGEDRVEFVVDGVPYEARTEIGIRILRAPCVVVVTEDEFTVEPTKPE